jgi:hypothetical protein
MRRLSLSVLVLLLGYNLGNALAVINARGSLLSAAMNDIEGLKQNKH